MLNGLKKWVRGLRAKSDPDPAEGGWNMLSGNTSWKNASTIWKERGASDHEDIYATQAVVFSCIRKIVTFATQAPLRVGNDRPDGWEDAEGHPLWSLLENPNAEQGYAEWLAHVVSHLLLTGTSYIWKWRNGLGAPAEFWPIPTSWVTPLRERGTGKLAGYRIWQGANKPLLTVPLGDIGRVIYPDPRNLDDGLGPLQAALRDVTMEEERQDYMLENLVNLRSPGMIFYQPTDWSREQKDEIRAVIMSGLGRGHRGRPLFLQGEGAKLEMPAPLKDLDWPGMTALSETRICAAFGVPPILIGLRSGLESATYSNYEQAERSFAQGTMAPLWGLLDAAFTRAFARDEGEDVECYHDQDAVPAMREDAVRACDRATKLFASSLITRNEAREMAGMESLPPERGDVFIIGLNVIETPLAGERKEEAPAPTGQEKFEGTAAENAEGGARNAEDGARDAEEEG